MSAPVIWHVGDRALCHYAGRWVQGEQFMPDPTAGSVHKVSMLALIDDGWFLKLVGWFDFYRAEGFVRLAPHIEDEEDRITLRLLKEPRGVTLMRRRAQRKRCVTPKGCV